MSNEISKLSEKSYELFKSKTMQQLFNRVITPQELQEAKRIHHKSKAGRWLIRSLVSLMLLMSALLFVSVALTAIDDNNPATEAANFILYIIGLAPNDVLEDPLLYGVIACVWFIFSLLFEIQLNWTWRRIEERNLHVLDDSDLDRMHQVIRQAKNLNADALYQIGEAFNFGELFPYDKKASWLMHAFAGELNHPQAAFEVSEAYPLDLDTRARWLRHASELGHVKATKQILSKGSHLDSGDCVAWRLTQVFP